MKLSDRLTRVLHLALVVSAIAALVSLVIVLTAFYGTIRRCNSELDAIHQDRLAVEAQSKLASHTLGIILQKTAIATDQVARLLTLEQTYWREQNKQMASIFSQADAVLAQFNDKLVPSATRATDSLNGAIQQVNGEVKNVRAAQVRLVADADRNLRTMEETQAKVNRSIDALDIPTLGKNVNIIAANTAEGTGDLKGIIKDGRITADKFVAPKTKWQRFTGALGVLWRVAAFAVVKAI